VLSDLIVCPVCHGELHAAGGRAQCEGCGRSYSTDPHLDLTPVPPPDERVLAKWPLWEHLQRNFVAAVSSAPDASLSLTARPDVEAFAAFCDFSGVVLDVGCGTQRLPSYADTSRCRFVGIDPLPGEPERDFEFVQGIGEFLPFRSDSLDQVLLATSLDHTLVPELALAEARRVIRPGGAVNVWFGELERQGSVPRSLAQRMRDRLHAVAASLRGKRPAPEPDPFAELDQPEGAADKFHAAHPTFAGISAWFEDAGLQLADVERIDYSVGCFMRGTK
jgi:SAM-dependent methyltransferase